jgi:hypothetical protein
MSFSSGSFIIEKPKRVIEGLFASLAGPPGMHALEKNKQDSATSPNMFLIIFMSEDAKALASAGAKYERRKYRPCQRAGFCKLKTKRGCEAQSPQPQRSVSCPSSLLPTRLAAGLEAKKSSSENQIRPRFASSETLVPPRCLLNNFGRLDLCKFTEKEGKKARGIVSTICGSGWLKLSFLNAD